MADQPTSGPEAAVFRVEKIYLKDLSFESPGAPDVFRQNHQPQAEINLGLKNRKVGEEHWEVSAGVHGTGQGGGGVEEVEPHGCGVAAELVAVDGEAVVPQVVLW